MKFWFGHKKKAEPAKEVAEPTPAPVEPKPEAVPESPKPAPPVLGTTPPPLGAAQSQKTEAAEPLKPATSLVRPQANQKVLYYQLMNGLYDAVMILDDAGHIVDCNERVNPVLGYSRDEMWDMPVSAVVKGIGPQIFQQMRDALHNDHKVLINAKCTRKDGRSFQGEVGVCILHLTRGENLVFTVRNVEKRVAALREQLRAEMSAGKPAAAKPATVRVVAKSGPAVKPVAAVKPVEPAAPAEKPADAPTATASRPRMVLKKVVR